MKHSKEHYVNQLETQIPIESPGTIKRTPELMEKLKEIGERALRQSTDQLEVLLHIKSSNSIKSAKQVYAFLEARKSTYGTPKRFYKSTEGVILRGTESQLLKLLDDAIAGKPPLNLLYEMYKSEPFKSYEPIELNYKST